MVKLSLLLLHYIKYSICAIYKILNNREIAIELFQFAEKPTMFVSNLINCGVYLFSASIYEQDFYQSISKKYQLIIDASKEDEVKK